MMDRRNINYRKRRSYYDDYKKTVSGEYVYAGALYEFIGKNGKSRKRWMVEMLLLNIVAFVLLILPGFMHVPGLNYCAYVILPYAAGVLISGYLLVVNIRLAAAKDSVKAWEYDKSVKVLPVTTVLACIIDAIGAVCEIIYVVVNGDEGMLSGVIVYVICHVVSAVLSCLMARLVKNAEWKRIDTSES